MLDVERVYLGVLPRLARAIEAIGQFDVDLARQLRRAGASVAMNLAEGCGSTKGTRRARYESALGSLRETMAGIEVAVAFGYLGGNDGELRGALDRVAAMCWRLLFPRR